MILEWRARDIAEKLGLSQEAKAFSFVAAALQDAVKKGRVYLHLEQGNPAGISTVSARVPEHARLGMAWVPEYASDAALKNTIKGHLNLLSEQGVFSVVVGIEATDEQNLDLYASQGFQLQNAHEIVQFTVK